MRRGIAGLVMLAVVGSLASPSPAGAAFSDAICPQATQYVMALGKLTRDDPPQRIYDGAQAATNAYERCSQEKLGSGLHEAQHYADVRGAGFAVLASRALISLGRFGDAKSELEHWRPLVQQVVDWRMETEAYASGDANGSSTTVGSSNNRRSMYYQSAGDIVTAIDAELATIAQRSGTQAQPQASPGHTP